MPSCSAIVRDVLAELRIVAAGDGPAPRRLGFGRAGLDAAHGVDQRRAVDHQRIVVDHQRADGRHQLDHARQRALARARRRARARDCGSRARCVRPNSTTSAASPASRKIGSATLATNAPQDDPNGATVAPAASSFCAHGARGRDRVRRIAVHADGVDRRLQLRAGHRDQRAGLDHGDARAPPPASASWMTAPGCDRGTSVPCSV